MKNKFVLKCFIAALVSLSAPVFAHDESSAREAGKNEAQFTMNEIRSNVQNVGPFEKALHVLLNVAANEMQAKGFNQEAEKLRGEWNKVSAYYFHNPLGFMQIGDHAPLNQWLADTYNMIEATVGEETCAQYHLDDIKSINYGYNVVINPKGDPSTGQAWGMEEYKLHFVPFTTAVSFWVGKLACVKFGKGKIGNFCEGSLDTFRSTIQEYIAPPVAEEIYNRFNPNGFRH